MSHWNYRRTVQLVDGEEQWDIRELYYYDGAVTFWTVDPSYPHGDTDDELRADLERYSDALNHPAFDLDTRQWREPFEPVQGSRSGKVRCTICDTRGYPGGRWQEPHRRGHSPCVRCGRPLSVRLDGSPRTHTRCPKRVA